MALLDGQTLLIVDDETEICTQLSLFFSAQGFRTLIAGSGGDALREFDQFRPAVVVTDYRMPGMDGLELLRAIKQRSEYCQVIFLSGHADIRIAVQAGRDHAFDFLSKPPNLNELLSITRAAVQRVQRRQAEIEVWHGVALSHERHTIPRDHSLLFFKCDLDERSRRRLSQELLRFETGELLAPEIILVLEGARYINNVGLNVLVDFVQALEKQKAKITLSNVQPAVLNYLHTLGYTQRFRITATAEAALVAANG